MNFLHITEESIKHEANVNLKVDPCTKKGLGLDQTTFGCFWSPLKVTFRCWATTTSPNWLATKKF